LKTSQKTSAALTAAVLLLGASAAQAANITISDNNTGSAGYSEVASGWYKGGNAYLSTPGATQALSEYQEVEPGMQDNANWDLAAFVTPATGKLGVVSAYDLANGFGGTTIGDIMISVAPATVIGYADPGTAYPQYITNSVYNYNFAVKFNFVAGTYTVLKLDANTLMENGEYNSTTQGGYNYNAASQPWRVANAYSGAYNSNNSNLGTVVTTGALTYTNTKSAASASALTGYSVTSDYKYYAEIDTTWLQPFLSQANPQALYKLTMECGNDNMLGLQTSGFNHVPDASATLSLLGLSFLGLVGFSKFKNRKVA